MATSQNFQNHARFDPKFHFFALPLLTLCFIASILHVWKDHSSPNVLLVPLTFGVLVVVSIARTYALQAQDRVIRLEESLRMERLGISNAGLMLRQIVALRFASDAELPALAERAKLEQLSGKQIKQAITVWRPDNDRI